MKSQLRIQPGQGLVLVTGANGYIGSTIVDILLQAGYYVRGTVRSEKPWLQALFDNKYGAGRFHMVVVNNLGVQANFELAMEGVEGVLHVVSPNTFEEGALLTSFGPGFGSHTQP
jgi:uncharacterized protein YbjT (DUF2867 family)